jgi:hypothetical protein
MDWECSSGFGWGMGGGFSTGAGHRVQSAEFPKPEQQRFAATATAMGLSYGQTKELLEIVVKKNVPAARRSAGG